MIYLSVDFLFLLLGTLSHSQGVGVCLSKRNSVVFFQFPENDSGKTTKIYKKSGRVKCYKTQHP